MRRILTMLRKSMSSVLVMFVLSLLVFSPAYARGKTESMKSAELQMTLRDLWVGHIFWVRSVVYATKFGDADAVKVAEENVVKNAKDIAAAVRSFYGK